MLEVERGDLGLMKLTSELTLQYKTRNGDRISSLHYGSIPGCQGVGDVLSALRLLIQHRAIWSYHEMRGGFSFRMEFSQGQARAVQDPWHRWPEVLYRRCRFALLPLSFLAPLPGAIPDYCNGIWTYPRLVF